MIEFVIIAILIILFLIWGCNILIDVIKLMLHINMKLLITLVVIILVFVFRIPIAILLRGAMLFIMQIVALVFGILGAFLGF